MKNIIYVLIPVFLLAVSGCNLVSNSSNPGYVRILIDPDIRSKTIIPEVGAAIAEYRIEFTGPHARGPIATTSASQTVELGPGAWTITVFGLDQTGGTGAIIAEGSVGVSVIADQVQDVIVYLYPLDGGTGDIHIEISWPEGPAVDESSEVVLENETYGTGDAELTFDGTARSIEFRISGVASGDHDFFAYLNWQGVAQATVSEVIKVYDNLTSSATIVLSEADFTQPPPAPVLSTPQEGTGSIILSWDCASSVVEEYQVQRSTVQTSGFTEIISLSGTEESYQDASVTVGTTYYYRITAENTGGFSEPSNTASLAVQPPLPGNSGSLTFSETSPDSTILSWSQASDNVSAEDALEYRVVYSESPDIDTVENAQVNGTEVLTWTSGVTSEAISGLTTGTTYYFNVLVRDEGGNLGIYAMNSETPRSGTLDMTITVVQPEDATITFSQDEDIEVPRSGTLNVTVEDTFDSYEWYLDALVVVDQTTHSFSRECSDLSLGVHHLTVFVTENGMLYSNSFRFMVTN